MKPKINRFFIDPGDNDFDYAIPLSLAEMKRIYNAIGEIDGWESIEPLVKLREKMYYYILSED